MSLLQNLFSENTLELRLFVCNGLGIGLWHLESKNENNFLLHTITKVMMIATFAISITIGDDVKDLMQGLAFFATPIILNRILPANALPPSVRMFIGAVSLGVDLTIRIYTLTLFILGSFLQLGAIGGILSTLAVVNFVIKQKDKFGEYYHSSNAYANNFLFPLPQIDNARPQQQ